MIVDFDSSRVVVRFSREERQTLLDESIAIPPEILELIRAATPEGDSVKVFLLLDDFELLVDGIAADGSHAKGVKRQRFWDGLFDRLRPEYEDANARDQGQGKRGVEDGLMPQLKGLLSEGKEKGLAHLNKAIGQLMTAHKDIPQPEMGGLTPNQAFTLIRCGWWAEPNPIRLKTDLSFDQLRSVPLFHNARMFLQAAVETNGAPMTATGNLTRQFVHDMLGRLLLEPGQLDSIQHICKVVNELDVFPLHVARIVCQEAGLLRKEKKRFVVTRKAGDMLSEDKAGTLYYNLFDALFRKINLAYFDRPTGEAHGVQTTIPYELYRLSQQEANTEYTVKSLVPILFLPAVLEEIGKPTEFLDKPTWMLTNRVIRPLESLGLVELVAEETRRPHYHVEHHVIKLPLFDAFIRFELAGR